MKVRRLHLASILGAGLLAACGGGGGDGGPDTPEIESATPDFGPLGGGSRILITGSGFLAGGAPPNQVLVGGHMAPLASAIDDTTLEVVLPAGDAPGDVEIVVYNSNGSVSTDGIFHYSEPPTITSMSPEVLRYDVGGEITVTGTGFEDEDAGVNVILIDGEPAVDVEVTSDTSMTFTALPGFVFDRPLITVVNRRGEGSNTGYQYGPGPAGGLIAFIRSFIAPDTYAYFFDPLTFELQPIPTKVAFGGGGGGFPFYRTVFQNAPGVYLGVDHDTFRITTLDLDAQTATPTAVSVNYQIVEAVKVGNTVFAYTRTAQGVDGQFGSIDLSTGVFTRIGTALFTFNGSGGGLAADAGGQVYVAFQDQIAPISRTTGVVGALVPLTGLNIRMAGMRFLGNQLYGVTRDNQIFTINTTSGVCEVVASFSDGLSSVSALDTVQ